MQGLSLVDAGQSIVKEPKNKTPRRTFYFEECESKAISLGTSRRGTHG